MDCVGNRFRLSGRLEKIEPLRRGARRGAGRQAEMGEDFDNHRRIFDACPERVEGAVMTFKAPPQFGHCSMSMSRTRLRSRAQLMRAGAPCACASSHEARWQALADWE